MWEVNESALKLIESPSTFPQTYASTLYDQDESSMNRLRMILLFKFSYLKDLDETFENAPVDPNSLFGTDKKGLWQGIDEDLACFYFSEKFGQGNKGDIKENLLTVLMRK